MKVFVVVLLTVCSLLSPSLGFSAEWTPLQVALLHPVQIFPKETKVQGFRLNLLYGVNDEMAGIDLGLINRTTGKTQGLQLGAFPLGGFNVTEELEGIQFAGFYGGANIANKDVSGVQISGIWAGANVAGGDVSGMQIAGVIGGINKAENLDGIQIAGILLGVNLAKNTKGIQLATLYNQAEDMEGLQIGIVNVCKKMRGVQIGVANIIQEGKLPFFPIINAGF